MEDKFKYGKRKRFFSFAIFGLAFVFLGGLLVMLLWNAILPSVILSVGKLNYWQAIGLLILSKILFGGFKGRPNNGDGRFRGAQKWREKLHNMTPEEREKFRNEWRERCGKRRS